MNNAILKLHTCVIWSSTFVIYFCICHSRSFHILAYAVVSCVSNLIAASFCGSDLHVNLFTKLSILACVGGVCVSAVTKSVIICKTCNSTWHFTPDTQSPCCVSDNRLWTITALNLFTYISIHYYILVLKRLSYLSGQTVELKGGFAHYICRYPVCDPLFFDNISWKQTSSYWWRKGWIQYFIKLTFHFQFFHSCFV